MGPSAPLPAGARSVAIQAVLFMALVLLAFARPGEVLFDDAFISFRYAERYAAGDGLTWNPGERVEGYSNLLHVLLLAGFTKVGVPCILASQLLGAVASAAALAAVVALCRQTGSGLLAGLLGAATLGATAPFHGWMFRGLETAPFTALLLWGIVLLGRDEARGHPPSFGASTCFGLLTICRPEGVLYALAVAAAIALRRKDGLTDALHLLAASAYWLGHLAFRLAYYMDYVPNTYHAKVWPGGERWIAGVHYVKRFLVESGAPCAAALAALAVAALWGWRHGAIRLALAALGAAVFFAVGSGGEGFPEGRFLHPAVALLCAAGAAALPPRAAAVVAGGALLLAVVSPTAAPVRRASSTIAAALGGDAEARGRLDARAALLLSLPDTPQVRTGRFLRDHLPPGAWIAVADCGQIPYASGLPTIDTVGLMDRHIARLPGRKHEKVDLAYVLHRRPEAIVLRLQRMISGLPMDMRMMSYRPFRDAYRLVHVEPQGPQAYFVFRQHRDPAREPAGTVDLLGLWRDAERTVLGPAGAREAGEHVRAGYHYLVMADERREALQRLLPEDGRPHAPLSELSAAMAELGAASRHGIVIQLPAGDTEGRIAFRLRGGPRAGGTLELHLGFAPWLWQRKLTRELAVLEVRITGRRGAFTVGGSFQADASRAERTGGFAPVSVAFPPEPQELTVELLVRRAGGAAVASDPFEVLLADPRLVPAGDRS